MTPVTIESYGKASSVKDYFVLIQTDRDELIWQVRAKLREGWEPLGGIAVARGPSTDSCDYFAQAMVLK